MMSRSELNSSPKPVVVQYGASTSGSRPEENYDVFINFRGPDVRTGFVKELNESLRSAEIGPFLDAYDINRGDDCWASIEKAIRGAPICICVFSPDYARSPWCLKELALIWELRSDKVILPIFYYVEPMHLREHAIDHKVPFRKGLNRVIEKAPEADVSAWKVVLNDISYIRGEVLDTNSTEDPEHKSRLEAKVVRKLVKDVQKRLESLYPVVIDQRASHIIQVLQSHSDEACTMGMWGMGGVGKTTLATKIYNRMKDNKVFKATSFLKDVAKRAAEKNGGLEALQTQLLSDLSGNKELVNVDDVDHGRKLLKQCLQSKQVLIVVDNVEDEALVTNALCIDKYLGIGSCCLVTSRNSEVGSTFRTTCVIKYEVELLQPVDARQLFCWHAFEESIFPREGFQELASKISSACGGLPLVLEAIGSLLKGEKYIQVWEEVLVNLQLHEALEYDDRVFNQLKLSFDSLEAREKDMFLDVACFFLGTDEDLAIETWTSLRWSPWVGLRNLKRKCLFKVEKSSLTMHDLLVDMGHKIVTMESRVDPGERSRLWMDDSEQMILANMTTNKTVTFSLAGSKAALQNLDFKSMKNLRLLNLDGCPAGIAHSEQEKDQEIRDNLPACNIALPQLLRHIKWHRMPMRVLPSGVYGLQWLVVLDFTGSKMERLWHSSSDVTFPGLRALILVDCTALSELPNSLTRSSHIRKLNMSGCSDLGMMPHDIGCLKELEVLDLQGCLKLEQLPESMGGLTSLIRLDLQSCSNLESLPESIGDCVSLRTLILAGCLGLVRLPSSVGRLSNLQSLLANACNRLTDFPDSMKELSSLKNLFLGGGELKAVPLFIEHLAGTLERLEIHNSKIESLPDFVSKLTKLQQMDILGCHLLHSVPESINDLKDLRRLSFYGCSGLKRLPYLISNLQNLEELDLECCERLENLPKTLGQLENLHTLELYLCKGLVEFPEAESLREPFSESCCQKICEFIQFRCEQNMMLRGDYEAAEKDLNFIKLVRPGDPTFLKLQTLLAEEKCKNSKALLSTDFEWLRQQAWQNVMANDMREAAVFIDRMVEVDSESLFALMCRLTLRHHVEDAEGHDADMELLKTVVAIQKQKGNGVLPQLFADSRKLWYQYMSKLDSRGALLAILKGESNEEATQSAIPIDVISTLPGKGELAASSWKPQPAKAAVLLEQAQTMVGLGDFWGAVVHLEAAVKLDPENVSILHNRGAAKGLSKDWAGACRDYNRVLELDPNRIETLLARGNMRQSVQPYDLEGALADCEKAIALCGGISSPRCSTPLRTRGLTKFKMGHFDDALADVVLSYQLCETADTVDYMEGLLKWKRGDCEGALRDLNISYYLLPDDSPLKYQKKVEMK